MNYSIVNWLNIFLTLTTWWYPRWNYWSELLKVTSIQLKTIFKTDPESSFPPFKRRTNLLKFNLIYYFLAILIFFSLIITLCYNCDTIQISQQFQKHTYNLRLKDDCTQEICNHTIRETILFKRDKSITSSRKCSWMNQRNSGA